MKVLSAPAEFSPDARPVCAAIGVFDGVHLGHQAVLRQTLEDAKGLGAWSVAVTFDRHPNTIVAPAHVPPLIYPLSKKLETLSALGLDAAYVIRFDQTFSQIPGERFILDLARDFGQIKSISVGETFMFGQKRSGNVALLRRLGPALGFEVRALPDVAESGQPISSTRIREALRVGALEAASRMLGRAYSLRGAVIPGLRLGRQLDSPRRTCKSQGWRFRQREFTSRTLSSVRNAFAPPSISATARPFRLSRNYWWKPTFWPLTATSTIRNWSWSS